jgi:hypothetical protein
MSRPTRAVTAAIPVAATLALFAARTHTIDVTGDEPHYLMIADSVASDRDLDLRNNYERDRAAQKIFVGSIAPHVYNVPRGWMPYHMPGLGVLIAGPFAIAGTIGARLFLILFAAILSWTMIVWFEPVAGESAARWLTIASMTTLPILFGAMQIYPDLPAGIVVTAMVVWLLRKRATMEDVEGKTGWIVFWLVTGLLPWLHVKYLPASVLLAIGGATVAVRRARETRTWTPVAASVLALVGIVALIAFNLWAFERPFGPRDARELTNSFSRAAEMFLGLHFDRSQGMFVQNPLLLAGIAALPVFAARRPWTALWWIAIYASMIGPNSLELARYGIGGPVGRFGWGAAFLWIVPIGYLFAAHRDRLVRYVKPIAIASLAYQALLAARWLQEPGVLFPHLDPPRDSLFPESLQRVLPSFYFWDFSSYWTYAPNLIAFACVALLLGAGTYTAALKGCATDTRRA